MKIFISWSGKLSHEVALELQEWLPNVLQQVRPYVSSEDIDKGSKWFTDISAELENCDFGILCLTKENMKEPWILFEAGALSKKLQISKVVPLLIDFEPSELEGPLVQFQATLIQKEDIFKLLNSINKNIEGSTLEKNRLKKSFNKWWEELDTNIKNIKTQNKEEQSVETKRPDREIIEETLEIVRAIRRNSQKKNFDEPIDYLGGSKRKTLNELVFGDETKEETEIQRLLKMAIKRAKEDEK